MHANISQAFGDSPESNPTYTISHSALNPTWYLMVSGWALRGCSCLKVSIVATYRATFSSRRICHPQVCCVFHRNLDDSTLYHTCHSLFPMSVFERNSRLNRPQSCRRLPITSFEGFPIRQNRICPTRRPTPLRSPTIPG